MPSVFRVRGATPATEEARAAAGVADPAAWMACLAAIAFIAAWTWVGASSSGQWGDHFEQFAWAHGVQWGYHKHPPLPTWILAGTIALFGPSTSWALVLAALCSLGTAFFTYRVAVELIGRPLAILALMFWGLQQPFSFRAYLFNHNTVMMLVISATAWALLKALKRPTLLRWWTAAGVLAGLSMLAKYQAVVPLGGMIIAAWLSGELACKSARTGLSAAMLLALVVFTPHLVWGFQHHFTTLAYAAQDGRTLSLAGRAWSVTTFLAQQVRLVFPALLLAGLLLFVPRAAAVSADQPNAASRRRQAWLFGLVGFPLMATVLTSPMLGLQLQNHWGYQALQFASLWLAWGVRRHVSAADLRWVPLAAALLQATSIGVALGRSAPGHGAREDSRYPAQQLADAVRRDWEDDTRCPLSIVVGPTFEAGIISVYNGGTAAVLEDGEFVKSPWITPADLQQRGAVYVAASPNDLPVRDATRIGTLDVSSVSPAPRTHVYWAIVPPESCPIGDR